MGSVEFLDWLWKLGQIWSAVPRRRGLAGRVADVRVSWCPAGGSPDESRSGPGGFPEDGKPVIKSRLLASLRILLRQRGSRMRFRLVFLGSKLRKEAHAAFVALLATLRFNWADCSRGGVKAAHR